MQFRWSGEAGRNRKAAQVNPASEDPRAMKLPIHPPVLPMLAKRIEKLPLGPEWIYEPKWDGFRTLVFRDDREVLIQSRDQKSLNRYFPELMEPLLNQLPKKCVADGEIVIARQGALDFDALQLRIHPAASRVRLLSEKNAGVACVLRSACNGRS